MPWIRWSALRRSTRASRSPSVVSWGRRMVSWYSPAASQAFPFMRTYVAEAALSPTSTAASPGVTPRARSARISPWSSARIASPTAVPSMILAGKIHRAGLADHHDLDLTGILELPLDLAGDLLGELTRPAVVDRVRGDHDAHLPARLDGVDLFDPAELARDLLELCEQLDVGLERLAPGAGPRARHRIRRLHDDADERLVRDVLVVGGDAVDDDGVLPVLRRHLDAQLHVRAVVLVRQHLADVVEQRAALGELHVELQLGRHDAGEPRDFFGVIEDVLPVGRPVFHAADELDQLRVHPLDARLVDRLLARLAAGSLALRACRELLRAEGALALLQHPGAAVEPAVALLQRRHPLLEQLLAPLHLAAAARHLLFPGL